MKNKKNGLLTPKTIIAAFAILILPIRLIGATTEVYPTGDLNLDGDRIQAAIDAAAPGDTIVLKSRNASGVPTAFVLQDETDDLAADVTIHSSQGDYLFVGDFWQGDDPIPGLKYQLIDINKPLTLSGELGPDGSLETRIVGHAFGNDDSYLWGTLIINAQGVTVQYLRMENLGHSIWALHPGFAIEGCEFFQCTWCGYLVPDTGYVYVDPSNPVRSYYRGNILDDCVAGPHLVGSEIELSGNSFNLSGGGNGIAIVSWGKVTTVPVDFTLVQNNLLENNEINIPNGRNAIAMHNNVAWDNDRGGSIRDNIIRDNTISGATRGLFAFARYSPSGLGSDLTDNVVSSNSFFETEIPFLLQATMNASIEGMTINRNQITGPCWMPIGMFSVSNSLIVENTLENVYDPAWGTWSVDLSGRCHNNVIINNDFRNSGFPGLRDGGEVPDIYLGPFTSDNLVKEAGSFMEETGGPEFHIFDEGVNNRIVGHSASAIAPPAGVGQVIKEALSEALE